MDRGLGLLTPPIPPPYLADRIIAGATAQRRVRRRRLVLWAGAAAAAAALLFVVWRAFFIGGAAPVVPGSAPMVQNHEPPAPASIATPIEAHATLRDSVEAAGSAVASLTSRTADEAVGKTRILIPAIGEPSLAKIDLESPPRSFREAGAEVSAGLEPVADSARRAIGLFLRELPQMGAKGGL